MSITGQENTNWAFWDCASYGAEEVHVGPLAVSQNHITSQPSVSQLPMIDNNLGSLHTSSRDPALDTSLFFNDNEYYQSLTGPYAFSDLQSAYTYTSQAPRGFEHKKTFEPMSSWIYPESDASTSSSAFTVSSSPSPEPQMGEQSQISRHQKRREQNRKAQLTFRQKRKDEIQRLQAEVIQLKAQLAANAQMKSSYQFSHGGESSVVCSLCKSYAEKCH